VRRVLHILIALAVLGPIGAWAGSPTRKSAEDFAQGDLSAAIVELETALADHPADAALVREEAAVREESDDPMAAAALYSRAATLEGDPRVPVEAAACLARAGHPESALSALDLILKDNPQDPDALWYEGLSHRVLAMDGGKEARAHWQAARWAFNALVRQVPGDAAAYRLLGECQEALKDNKDAEQSYLSALKYEPSYRDLHVRLARLFKKRGATAEALARYERAVAASPWDTALAEEKRALVRRAPSTERLQKAERTRKWKELKPLSETPLPSSPITVRVGVETHLHRLVLRCGGVMQVSTPAGTPLRRLASDTDYVVVWRDAKKPQGNRAPIPVPTLIALTGDNPLAPPEDQPNGGSGVVMDAKGVTLMTFDRRIWFEPMEREHTVALHAVETGSGYFFASEEDRFYRGLIEIHPGPGLGFAVVNRVSLEAYVAGVLPSEMPASWPLEALKAQAVAARTEGLSKMGRHNREGFDVCDEVHCQAYVGIKAERSATNQAVAETAGVVLWRDGRPFPAVYSAQCGGHSQSYREAWGYDLPGSGVADFDPHQVKAVFPLAPHELKEWVLTEPDAYCKAADLKGYQQFRWTYPVSAADLEAAEKLRELGPLQSVRVMGRSTAGWVGRVTFVGESGSKDFTRDSVRGILGGIRSNLFWLEDWRSPSGRLREVWVYGGGWGHGVGMCQVGARGLAKLGKSFRGILEHYYPQASFKSL